MAVHLRADALTTLSAAKEELGIPADDVSQDQRIKRLINAATSAIGKYCDRDFARATITAETHPMAGGLRVVFKRTPIVSIVSVTANAAVIPSTSYLLENADAGIVFFPAGLPEYGTRRRGIAQDIQPGTHSPLLSLAYVGGYVTAQQARVGGELAGEDVTLPDEIETACLDLVGYYKAQRGQIGEIQSESVGDASVTYRADPGAASESNIGIPAHIRGRLNPYRRCFRFV